MTSKWKQYKEKNGVTPFDLFKSDTEWAEDSVAESRYSLCLECPELINITKQCKKCGCFMATKTKLAAARCPIGKW